MEDGSWSSPRKSESLAHRCLKEVGLKVEAVVGHVYGDEKRDALIAHNASIYVGDTITDVKSALDASTTAVAVTTGPDDASRPPRSRRPRRARLPRRVPGLARCAGLSRPEKI